MVLLEKGDTGSNPAGENIFFMFFSRKCLNPKAQADPNVMNEIWFKETL